jgi:recombinational DNA repair protein (RecF pathway)
MHVDLSVKAWVSCVQAQQYLILNISLNVVWTPMGDDGRPGNLLSCKECGELWDPSAVRRDSGGKGCAKADAKCKCNKWYKQPTDSH